MTLDSQMLWTVVYNETCPGCPNGTRPTFDHTMSPSYMHADYPLSVDTDHGEFSGTFSSDVVALNEDMHQVRVAMLVAHSAELQHSGLHGNGLIGLQPPS